MAQHQQMDYIRKVAVVGGSGHLGSYFVKYLLATGKHQVTVLTRADSTTTILSDPNLSVKKVDYSSESSLVDALRGNDFLVITINARAPRNVHPEIVNAAAKAGVEWIMPNYYGAGLGSRGGTLHTDPVLGSFGRFIEHVKNAEGGRVNYVAMVCGFWYEHSLARGEQWLGFDIANRTATFYDDGKTKLNMSTWDQCGRALAGLLSLPYKDGKPAVQDWKNEGLYLSSFLICQRDILDSLNRVLGTTDADWTIKYEPSHERYKKGIEEMQAGNMLGYAKAMYARLLFPVAEGDYETGQELDNKKLGLPKEDFDEATKRAVELSEKSKDY